MSLLFPIFLLVLSLLCLIFLLWIFYLSRRLKKANQQVADFNFEKIAREKDLLLLQEKYNWMEARTQENKELHEKDAQTLKFQFESLATRIFEEKNLNFRRLSIDTMSKIVDPLQNRIEYFQKTVNEMLGKQEKEHFALKEEIKRIVDTSQKMNIQAEDLTRALKGNVKVQGNWGEFVLERILEESGLRENIEYIKQANLRHSNSEDTGILRLRPDIILKLPEGRHVVIDSKVSLVHYEHYINAQRDAENDKEKQKEHFSHFVSSVRAHIQDLAKKAYASIPSLRTPDFVFMFMPIEGVYAHIMQASIDLHDFAWKQRIVIVGPSTLFASLRTIASVWRIERHNKNADEIARQASNLYDKIVSTLENMEKIGLQINVLQHTYDEAIVRIKTGDGNVIGRIERLRKLGLSNKKTLPKKFDNREDSVKTVKIGEESV